MLAVAEGAAALEVVLLLRGASTTELLDVRAAILAADPAFYTLPVAPSPAGLDIDTSAFGFEGTSLMEV